MRLLSLDEQENQMHKPMMEGKSFTFIEAELIDCLQYSGLFKADQCALTA